ncbi:hypothetical protein [Alkalibacillus haloalkaliphilus]|uniref:Uncharacterized protein n=1 Tax=Alkalibacillus haloalkaliphilus TaxID=94136 RepID=A0A511WCU0_9BACI|nr:hypothetical protein [Alkalibacillus haloalkaliphilus]GEN47082.1 hypothetical protein AHA02nite_28580 [Alkalibacillus haloalkaliphilus]
MYLCPLCNGLEQHSLTCSKCDSQIDDQGKMTDYFDDYSAYMDIASMKLLDGDRESKANHQCLHYFYCKECNAEEVKAINEEEIFQ